ncbi:MAG: Hpt domain-containing protein, partial [Fibrobacterota bacterium]
MSYDNELIDGFIEETNDVIEEVEPSLIELSQNVDETHGVDKEVVNAIFRLFHSMKSSAAFLGFSNIARLTHVAENLIQEIREDRIALNEDIATTLCGTTDLINAMLLHIKEERNDNGFNDQIEENITQLSRYTRKSPEDAGAPAAAEEAPPRSTTSAVSEKNSAPAAGEKPPSRERNSQLISPEMYTAFVTEANEQLDTIEQCFLQLEEEGYNQDTVEKAYRTMHSFKGNCSFMNFDDPERYSHLLETILTGMKEKKADTSPDNIAFLLEAVDLLRNTVSNINEDHDNTTIDNLATYVELMKDLFSSCFTADRDRQAQAPEDTQDSTEQEVSPENQDSPDSAAADAPQPPAPEPEKGPDKKEKSKEKSGARLRSVIRSDIRVRLEKLDTIINLTGELVISESMVTRNPAVKDIDEEGYNRAVHQLRRICSELQDASMALRMVPLSSTFKKMIRVVHDLSRKINKKVKLDIVGEETEVDKTVIELIGDPLVHIIRNSCDHGIEQPEERRKKGKPENGLVRIEGRHEGGEVWIMVSDDGQGLNREKIASKAVEKGIISQAESAGMADEDVYQLIFSPGFSTADTISDVSGRGVGMDVVKRNIEKMNGEIDINSEPGKGSTFIIRIP